MRSYLVCAPPAALASCATVHRLHIATLVYRSLSGKSLRYQSDDCPLVADAHVRHYVLRTLEHLSVGRAAVLEPGPFPPQDKSGIVCRPISDYVGYYVGCHTASSGSY